MAGFNTSAESTPIIDGWGFGDYWEATDWIDWFYNLKAKYGAKDAKDKFLAGYHSGGNFETLGSAHLGWSFTNEHWINFAKENKLWESINSGLNGAINNAGNLGIDAVSSTAEGGSSLVKGIGSFASGLGKVVPVVVVLIVLIVIAFYYSQYKAITK